MELAQAGGAVMDGYIGYMDHDATSHDALDASHAVQKAVRNVSREVVTTVKLIRDGAFENPARDNRDPLPT